MSARIWVQSGKTLTARHRSTPLDVTLRPRRGKTRGRALHVTIGRVSVRMSHDAAVRLADSIIDALEGDPEPWP